MPGTNPFEGYTPEVPDGEKLDFGSERFQEFEQQGISSASMVYMRVLCSLT